MPVINSQGLVGRVIETTRSTSKVLLISDPGLGVSAVIQRSRQEGLVCGALGGYLIMRYLAEASDIRPQDAVVTSGLSQNYPKGLLIGTVVDISRESGLGIYARIRPAASLSNIEEVLVIVQ
jgi:rod shape-determining protein MreC